MRRCALVVGLLLSCAKPRATQTAAAPSVAPRPSGEATQAAASVAPPPSDVELTEAERVERDLACTLEPIEVGEPSTKHVTAFLPPASWSHFEPTARCCTPSAAPKQTVCLVSEERTWRRASAVDGWSDRLRRDHLVIFAKQKLVSRKLVRFMDVGGLDDPRRPAYAERRYELAVVDGEVQARTLSRRFDVCAPTVAHCTEAPADAHECLADLSREERQHRTSAFTELCKD